MAGLCGRHAQHCKTVRPLSGCLHLLLSHPPHLHSSTCLCERGVVPDRHALQGICTAQLMQLSQSVQRRHGEEIR